MMKFRNSWEMSLEITRKVWCSPEIPGNEGKLSGKSPERCPAGWNVGGGCESDDRHPCRRLARRYGDGPLAGARNRFRYETVPDTLSTSG
jgi:hypothetical protein